MSQNNDLAEERTDWAEDRTILANERTFAGWMRTGMASVALAVGLRAVFASFEPTWIAKSVASIFIILAVFIFWAAQSSAAQTLSRLNDNNAHAQPHRRMLVISIILAIGALATGGILWAL
ncbi:YidH family protein [Sulfitobacter sp.]|jgi:putative membrane protein|uniref:YidH family protein n=1 Tax=Sulfitobacter sp. TaxID=1903071 RepID=UPI00304E758E